MKKFDWFKTGILIFLFGVLFLGIVKIYEIDEPYRIEKTADYLKIYPDKSGSWVKINLYDQTVETNMKVK